jgi:hypothetical protein
MLYQIIDPESNPNLFCWYSSLFFCHCNKYHYQKQSGEERAYFILLLQYSIHGCSGRKSRHKYKKETNGETLLTGLLFLVCTAAFPMQHRPTCPGMASLTHNGYGPPASITKSETPNRHDHKLMWTRKYSSWVSLFSGDSRFVSHWKVMLTVRANNTGNKHWMSSSYNYEWSA